jgi:hypothetical protein
VPFVVPGLLGTSIFLYPSERDAGDGANWGGSGFLVSISSQANPSRTHLYAVSNDHVIHSCPVIRLVQVDGDSYVLSGTDADWHSHPDGDDIAIRPLGAVAGGEFWSLGADLILSQADIDRDGIGPGDDCLMIGRYINQEFRQFDRPVVRFGNLAMMPERVYQSRRSFEQESFLVDMRSQAGFSGSPVLVYFEEPGWRRLSPLSDVGVGDDPEANIKALKDHVAERKLSAVMTSTWLLGIDWGHLPVSGDVFDGNRAIGRMQVSAGMAGVVPAWKLLDLLNEEGVNTARHKAEEQLAEGDEGAAVLDESKAGGNWARRARSPRRVGSTGGR